MKFKKTLALLLILVLISASFNNFNYSAYADITNMELASGAVGDSVSANFSGNTITISGSGTIKEANWVALARAIDGANSSYSGSNPGWQIAGDINMVFEPGSTIQFAEPGFKNQVSGWFQNFPGTIAFNDTLDTANLTDMSYMFYGASKFNDNLSGWETGNVKNMAQMFRGASAFNGDISTWDTGNVKDMLCMFNGATAFNGDLSGWNTVNVENMSHMFNAAHAFTSDLSRWNTSNVENMACMFLDASAFNSDLSNWDTKNVNNMVQMFRGASAFNSNLSKWKTAKVENMAYMFRDAHAFISDLSDWDTSQVENMSSMFCNARAFTADLSKWQTTKVKNMSLMFYGAANFNSDLSNWDTSNVENMSLMFCDAKAFNSDLSDWNTSNVENMSHMFFGANLFNSDLSKWQTAKVENMAYMFRNAYAFNSDISGWDTSSVTDASAMFRQATALKNINLLNRDSSMLAVSNALLTGTDPDTVKFDKLAAFLWKTPAKYQVKEGDVGSQTITFADANQVLNFKSDTRYELYRLPVLAEVTIGYFGKSYDGNSVQPNDLMTVLNNPYGIAGTLSFKDANTNIVNPGDYNVTVIFTPNDGEKYSSVELDAHITIEKATPVALPPSGLRATYGQTLGDVAFASAGTGAGTWRFSLGDNQIINRVGNQTYEMQFTPTDTVNYQPLNQTVTIDVAKKSVALSDVQALDKVYDGSVAANVTAGAITVAIAGDDVGIKQITASYHDAAVGQAKPITVTAVTLHGEKADNYTVQLPTGLTANISKADYATNPNNGLHSFTAVGEYGQPLSAIQLSTDSYNIFWDSPNTTLTQSGQQEQHSATLVPKNDNYQSQAVSVSVSVQKAQAPTLADAELHLNVPLNKVVTTTLGAIKVGIPKDSGAVGYQLKTIDDQAGIISEAVINGGYLTYRLIAEAAGKQVKFVIDAIMANYQTARFQINLIAEERAVPELSVSDIVKLYDKKPIEEAEVIKKAKFSGQVIAGNWQFNPKLSDIIAAGNYTVEARFTPDDSDNYSQAKINFAIEITKRPLVLKGIRALDRTFAKNNIKVDLVGGRLVGVLAGDDVSIELGNGTENSAFVRDDRVADNKPVVTAIRLSGAAANNYYVEQPTVVKVNIFEDDDSDDDEVVYNNESKASKEDAVAASSTSDKLANQQAANDATAVQSQTAPKQQRQRAKLSETASFTMQIQSIDIAGTAEQAVVSQAVNLNNGVATLMIDTSKSGALAKLDVQPKTGYGISEVALYDENGETVNYIIDENGLFNILVPKGELSVDVKFNYMLPERASFSDVPLSQPHALAIEYLSAQDIVKGITANAFEPLTSINRASFVELLHNLSSVQRADSAVEFKDVRPSDWYYQALQWGVQAGVAKGYSRTSFEPLKAVNREELLAFLYRYQMKEKAVEDNTLDLTMYSDSTSVSGYARTALKWALAHQIIAPNEQGQLLPQKTVNRAEAADIIYRYLEN